MHNNICSLTSNFHKVEELFLGSTYRPQIVALSETKLNSSSVIPSLKGFTFEHNDSPTAAGGVGFICQKIYSILFETTYPLI